MAARATPHDNQDNKPLLLSCDISVVGFLSPGDSLLKLQTLEPVLVLGECLLVERYSAGDELVLPLLCVCLDVIDDSGLLIGMCGGDCDQRHIMLAVSCLCPELESLLELRNCIVELLCLRLLYERSVDCESHVLPCLL